MNPAIGKAAIDNVASADDVEAPNSTESPHAHGAPELTGADGKVISVSREGERTVEDIEESEKGWFAYLKTRNFYLALLLGQILSLSVTSASTFSQLLANQGTSIPAFQTLFNYVLLNLIFTSYTLYRYGFRKWFNIILKDGWKYIILSFFDVEGNYFTVLAFRYTTILSAQLINFWAIVLVVVISFLFLHVRYHPTQIIGILICVGGMGILLASDHITGSTNFGTVSRSNQLKGDLFALAGATFYGIDNVLEEFFVSKRPVYEVVGQLGFWGVLFNGAQAGIFDRNSFRTATWNGKVGGYMVGYTLCLSLFYSIAPLVFRIASAAFFNISLLTSNFWAVVIGIQVFRLHVHWMYPIAFVCIMGGLMVYFVGKKVMGEARKPWLGRNQEGGISGVGTARRAAERGEVAVV